VNTGSRACPWCEIEKGGGPDLFISITASAKLNSTFDMNLLWRQIEAVSAPKPVSIVAGPTGTNTPPAELPTSTSIFGYATLACGAVAAVSFVVSLAGIPAAVSWALVTGVLWAILRSVSPYARARRALLGEVKNATAEVERAESEWRSKMEGFAKTFSEKKQGLAKFRSEYQNLPQIFRKEEEELQSKKHEHQLKAFLRGHFIEDASIKGIGPGRISVLRSFGIETALDVTTGRVSAVDGFGLVDCAQICIMSLRGGSDFVPNERIAVDQGELFGPVTPAAEWDADIARHALDELFTLASGYTSTQAYRELLTFIARFRFCSPFNAMLVHAQLPGATFVAPPHRWLRDYGRRIKTGARPIVILQPMGPVMFVFDVSDTEPTEHARVLPREVECPFDAHGGEVGNELPRTKANARRDGVDVIEREAGSQSAGLVRTSLDGRHFLFEVKKGSPPERARVPLRYELLLNARHSRETRYATLCHELAHLYCGHLGTPNERWWPDRRGLALETREFEAESVCHLVCRRLSLDTKSDEYLAQFFSQNKKVPPISFDCVMKSAGLIEQMGNTRMEARKEPKS
jgi:hypothetical protein